MSDATPFTPAAPATPPLSGVRRPDAEGRRHTRIRPSRGWALVDLREAWQFRELLMTLAGRDVKVRYKQTAVGVAWVVLQPLVTALVFAFVFGRVARLPMPDGTPLVLAIFAALCGFDLFKNTLNRSTNALVGNAHLVRKIWFPRVLLPASTALSSLLDFAVSLGVFVVIYALCGLLAGREGSELTVHAPGWHLLLFPVCALVLMMIALGIGTAATALAASYRDVTHVVPVTTQLLMYASPVMYDLSYVFENASPTGQFLYLANPLAGVISVFRYSLIGAGTVSWGAFAWSVAFAIGSLIVGMLVFRRMEKEVADVI